MTNHIHIARAGPFPLKRILVIGDLSAASENAAWRAALLAREHGAWVRLVQVPSFLRRDAGQAQLRSLAWRLQEHLQVAVLAQSARGGLRRELVAAARDADLVVVASDFPGAWGLRRFLSPWRLAHTCGKPVLVVRRPAAVAYQRVLVGAGQGAGDAECIATATGMAGGPHLELLGSLQAGAEMDLQPLPDSDDPLGGRRISARIWEFAQRRGPCRMKEAPCVVSPADPQLLLDKEQDLFPDLLVVPSTGARSTSWLRRGFADALLVPVSGQAPRSAGTELESSVGRAWPWDAAAPRLRRLGESAPTGLTVALSEVAGGGR